MAWTTVLDDQFDNSTVDELTYNGNGNIVVSEDTSSLNFIDSTPLGAIETYSSTPPDAPLVYTNIGPFGPYVYRTTASLRFNSGQIDPDQATGIQLLADSGGLDWANRTIFNLGNSIDGVTPGSPYYFIAYYNVSTTGGNTSWYPGAFGVGDWVLLRTYFNNSAISYTEPDTSSNIPAGEITYLWSSDAGGTWNLIGTETLGFIPQYVGISSYNETAVTTLEALDSSADYLVIEYTDPSITWAPFAENLSPLNGSGNISVNSNISFTIAEPSNLIETSTTTNIALYYDPNITNVLMYQSDTGFEPGFDGPSSSMTFVTGGSIDGYDAYNFVIDFESALPYGTNIEYEINVQDTRFDT